MKLNNKRFSLLLVTNFVDILFKTLTLLTLEEFLTYARTLEDAKSKAEEVENFVFFLGVMTNIRVHVQLKRKHVINVRRKDILLEDVGVKLQN